MICNRCKNEVDNSFDIINSRFFDGNNQFTTSLYKVREERIICLCDICYHDFLDFIEDSDSKSSSDEDNNVHPFIPADIIEDDMLLR